MYLLGFEYNWHDHLYYGYRVEDPNGKVDQIILDN